MKDPEAAKQFEEEYLTKNKVDDVLNYNFDLSEIKYYPGSQKGPLPDDDPESYSRWFV